MQCLAKGCRKKRTGFLYCDDCAAYYDWEAKRDKSVREAHKAEQAPQDQSRRAAAKARSSAAYVARRSAARARQRAVKADRRAAGLCPACGTCKPPKGRVHCLECRPGTHQRRVDWIRRGACSHCGTPHYKDVPREAQNWQFCRKTQCPFKLNDGCDHEFCDKCLKKGIIQRKATCPKHGGGPSPPRDLDAFVQRYDAKRLSKIARGECRDCTKPAVPGRAHCQACLERRSER